MIKHRDSILVLGLASAITLGVTGTGAALAADQIAWIDALGLRSGMPLVLPPRAAGAVIGVDEHRKADSFTQVIALAGDPGTRGENTVTVTVTRDGLAPRIEPADLYAEMADHVPAGMSMALDSADRDNVFGVFGAATGSEGPLSCLYGWQSVNLADPWISGRASSIFRESHAMSIRVRLCRTQVGAAELAAVMTGLQSGTAGTRPVFGSSGRDGYDALEAATGPEGARLLSGPDMAPDPGPWPAARRPEIRPARRKVVHPAHRRLPVLAAVAGADRPVTSVPMAGMPDVPLPP